MVRQGYIGEKIIKDLLVVKFGKENVVKVAIGGAEDFLILDKGKVNGVVEVKETIKEAYYPSKREKFQFERIRKFAKYHNCSATLFIVYRRGSGKKSVIKMADLNTFN